MEVRIQFNIDDDQFAAPHGYDVWEIREQLQRVADDIAKRVDGTCPEGCTEVSKHKNIVSRDGNIIGTFAIKDKSILL